VIEEVELHSYRPSGLMQEISGLLIAHFVIRKLAFDAAEKAAVSPRQIDTPVFAVARSRASQFAHARLSRGRKMLFSKML